MRRHNPPSVWAVPEAFRSIYSHAAEVTSGARLMFVSSQSGIAPDGTVAPHFDDQLNQAMENVEALPAASGMSKADIVKANYYLTRASDLPALGVVRRQRWSKDEPEAVTVIVVAALARADCLAEVEAVGARREG